MRRRLLFSTLAVAVIAVLLLGVPLTVVVGRLIKSQAHEQLQHEAKTLADEIEFGSSLRHPIRVNRIAHAYPDRYIVITLSGLPTVRVGSKPDGDTLSATENDGATRVKVARDDDDVNQEMASALFLIISMSLVAVLVAVGLAMVQARKMSRPLLDLAETAQRLGRGDARPRGHRYGVAELDRVAEVLDDSAVQLGELIAGEREFATDASHQLRTPLTALYMRLEEIVSAADDPSVVREEGLAALNQTERLSRVVDELLGRARRTRGHQAKPLEIDEIVDQQVQEWRPAFQRAQRHIGIHGTPGLHAVATPGGLAQVLATLLDNALAHGEGEVTLRTNATQRSVVIEVSDEGGGVPAELVSQVFERSVSGSRSGTGLGLALARSLAEADGGRLELVRARPPVFALFLRRVPETGSGGDASDGDTEPDEPEYTPD